MDHGLVKIQKIRVPKKWIIHIKKKHGFLLNHGLNFWIIKKKIFLEKRLDFSKNGFQKN
jgi:hypothetical protein